MGIVSRISDIVTAKIHAVLDRAEDQEALLAQVIREMEDDLARARRYAAVAIAAERRLLRERDDSQSQAEHWKGRARAALAAGQEVRARRALARKQEYDMLARTLDEQHAEALQTGESARAALQQLESRLADASRRQRALDARHRTAQVRVEAHRVFGSADFGASQARFNRLESRLSQCVEEPVAEADLCDHNGIELEFSDLERRQAIEAELAELKHDMPGSAEQR